MQMKLPDEESPLRLQSSPVNFKQSMSILDIMDRSELDEPSLAGGVEVMGQARSQLLNEESKEDF